MEYPVLRPEPTSPPPGFLWVFLFWLFFFFKICCGRKYSGLGIPENKFSNRARDENKYSVQTKFVSPPPT